MEKKKIIYIDDEESLRMLIQNQLSIEGYDVDVAEDGDIGLEMIEKNNYDLILLDIRMPRMDGLQVLDSLRKKNIKTRVIMLTAVSELNTAINAVKAGANDYITKPYNFDELLSCINRVLVR